MEERDWEESSGIRVVDEGAVHGIPENDCDQYMAAQFAYVDALVSGDEEAIEKANEATKRWRKYGG